MPRVEPKRGIVLGIVGPVCAGKSEVSRRLKELGALVYEADQIVRQLYEQPDVKQAVRELFGADVFGPDGSVDRSAIAARVFGADADPDLRRQLTEQVIFPRTGTILRAAMDRFRATAGAADVFVLDAPTLFEAGRTDWCDHILLVTAPTEQRYQWAAARGWPPAEVGRRDAALLPEAAKRSRVGHVIENNTSLADLRAAVDRVWQAIRADR